MSFELDLNLHRIDRVVYNGLDLLGDLGGLQQALAVVIGAVVTLLNYQKLENYLVKLLFSENTDSRNNHGADEIRVTSDHDLDIM